MSYSSNNARSKRTNDGDLQGAKSQPKLARVSSGKQQKTNLKWRGNPEETYSDWTIEILYRRTPTNDHNDGDGAEKEREVVDTYHVHKVYLGHGTRKSEYFRRLFRNGNNFKDSSSQTSRIPLQEAAAQAFPQLLDYVYSQEDALMIDTQSAAALHYLGDYFEMKQLQQEAWEFIQADLSFGNIHTYYQHAKILCDDRILKRVTKFLAQNIMQIKPSSPILEVSDPDLWVNVLEIGNGDQNYSSHMTEIVAEYGMTHTEELDMEVFEKLTSAAKLPNVSHKAALKLCKLEDVLSSPNKSTKTAGEKEETMTPLQKRCAVAMSSNWKEIAKRRNDEDMIDLLKKRKPGFLVDLFLMSLQKASRDWDESQRHGWGINSPKDTKETLKTPSSTHKKKTFFVDEEDRPIPKFKDVKSTLQKLGFVFYSQKMCQYYCFPGKDPRSNNNLEEGEDYFKSVESFRTYLCAYGVGNMDFPEASVGYQSLQKWIRFSIVKSVGKRAKLPEKYEGTPRFWTLLCLLGMRYDIKGYYLKDGTHFSTEKEFCSHISRFGLPVDCEFDKITKDERLQIELHFANMKCDTPPN